MTSKLHSSKKKDTMQNKLVETRKYAWLYTEITLRLYDKK